MRIPVNNAFFEALMALPYYGQAFNQSDMDDEFFAFCAWDGL